MNNYELHEAAQELEDTVSPYRLARSLVEANEREQALAAHVEKLQKAGDNLREPWDLSTILGAETRRRVEGWDKARAESTNTSLTKRDLIKQADAFEKVYNESQGCMIINRGSLIDEARNHRQQAAAL